MKHYPNVYDPNPNPNPNLDLHLNSSPSPCSAPPAQFASGGSTAGSCGSCDDNMSDMDCYGAP